MISMLPRLSDVQKKVAAIVGIVLLLILAVYVTEMYKLRSLIQTVEAQIKEQQTLLMQIAGETSNNSADSYTETIIRDCAVLERTRFDNLLSRLNEGLSTTELSDLDRLFGRCGTYYAERKAVMVGRMERELEIYQENINQLESLKTLPVENYYQLDVWNELVRLEKEQAGLFMELVIQQDKIIQSLLEGKVPESEQIKAILRDVSEAQGMLIVTNKQAADTRALLKAL